MRLEAWDASGMSLRAFAVREGLKPHTLWLWKKRLRGATAVTTSFASVVVGGASASSGRAFELVVRGGMSLRIPADFDEAALARLLAVLGRD